MKSLKTTVQVTLLVAIAAVWFLAGTSYGFGSTEPVQVPVETIVEVPVAEEWERTLVLGITPEGSIVEAPESDEGFVYVLTIHYNAGDTYNEVMIWLPLGDAYAGVSIKFSSAKYAVDVRRVGEPEDLPTPAPEEGDEF